MFVFFETLFLSLLIVCSPAVKPASSKLPFFGVFAFLYKYAFLGSGDQAFRGLDFPQTSPRLPGGQALPCFPGSGVRAFRRFSGGQGPDFQGPEVRRPGARGQAFRGFQDAFRGPGTGAMLPGLSGARGPGASRGPGLRPASFVCYIK